MEKKEEFIFLKHLVETLYETSKKIEESYNKKDYVEFEKLKKLILRLQDNIEDSFESPFWSQEGGKNE